MKNEFQVNKMQENVSKPPMFIRIDEYEDIQDIMRVVKKKLDQAKSILNRIYSLKTDEDAEIDRWNSILEDVEGKMDSIERALFEQEG
ncbi:hypothetical protein CMO89_01095 [Candidatus Woesearchaeota archaeon]|nr:hypothetical protein [Candidatus Woesearchaeota archaeon]|tara:strand:- start:10755 stop:11018 length:264 start_codon:yes stop_codon:yes gene_type:complete